MEKYAWVKHLIHIEKQYEEGHIVDLTSEFDEERELIEASLDLLAELKLKFTDAVTVFNELKKSPLGKIKIYTIAKTHADFMLFRNGCKLVFSLKNPGIISIRFLAPGSSFQNQQFTPLLKNKVKNQNSLEKNFIDENLIIAKVQSFYEINWTYHEQICKVDNLTRYFLTLFTKESTLPPDAITQPQRIL